MTWSDPDLIKQMEELAATKDDDPSYQLAVQQLERQASSSDTRIATQAKIILAMMPHLNELKIAMAAGDVDKAATLAVAISGGLSAAKESLLAVLPPENRADVERHMQESAAAFVQGMEEMKAALSAPERRP